MQIASSDLYSGDELDLKRNRMKSSTVEHFLLRFTENVSKKCNFGLVVVIILPVIIKSYCFVFGTCITFLRVGVYSFRYTFDIYF